QHFAPKPRRLWFGEPKPFRTLLNNVAQRCRSVQGCDDLERTRWGFDDRVRSLGELDGGSDDCGASVSRLELVLKSHRPGDRKARFEELRIPTQLGQPCA